eukprot:3884075-Rhodomonas_salina.1
MLLLRIGFLPGIREWKYVPVWSGYRSEPLCLWESVGLPCTTAITSIRPYSGSLRTYRPPQYNYPSPNAWRRSAGRLLREIKSK